MPLGEERERYEVTVQKGEKVLALDVDAPSAAVTAADQRRVFGEVLKGAVRLRVAQLSTVYGRGAALERVIDVK